MDQSHRGVIIKCRRIATARDLRRFGIRLQDFITQQCREYIVLADIEVIIQSATPNAMANMQAITAKYGPAPTAYFVVPLVGSLFIDFFNALIITTFMNFL